MKGARLYEKPTNLKKEINSMEGYQDN